MLDVNVLGTLGWVQEALRGGLATAAARSSTSPRSSGVRPAPGIAFYGVTKAALIHLTEELAVELAPDVRVNAVAPAVVKTRFATALYEGREEQVAATYPLRRLGVPEDVAGAVAFLCSARRRLDHRPDPGDRRRRDADGHRAVTPPGLDLERLRAYLGSAGR